MKIALIGGTSGIGRALADAFLARGDELFLTGRAPEEVERIVADLEVRHGVPVYGAILDGADVEHRRRVLDNARQRLGGLDGVIVTFGEIGDRQRARTDSAYARKLHDINYQAPADLLEEAAAYFEANPVRVAPGLSQQPRFLAAIGSVAGDRGRQSNYHYGAAKAALHSHLQGLRHRMHAVGTRVLTVKPGLIDTPMVFGRDDLVFVVSAERAASEIIEALDKGTNELYTPWFWRWIMLVIRLLPEFIFRRLKV
ncbi:MAG: SDR family NAD(P)-dependent oxidoreductase [Planctomycetota bacterium]